MTTGADRDDLAKLREQIRVLELENDRLAERAEDTLLLGLLAEKIRSSGDPHELISSGLEQISILKDIVFCASCHPDRDRFVVSQSYCSRTSEDFKGQTILFPPETIGPISADSYLLDADDCAGVELSTGIAAVIRPTSMIMVPVTSGQGRDFYFVFADDRPDMNFADLRFLLHRALDIMASRIDNLDLLEKLTALNLDLDMRVLERTRDLQETNKSLQREIAERRETEQALKASESRFRTLAENAFDAVFILDESLRLVNVNTTACRTLGYERGDLLGADLFKILERDDPGFWDTVFDRFEDESVVHTGEQTLLPRDADPLAMETRMAVIRLDGRRHLMLQSRDVSEQKSLEEQLLQSMKMEAVGRLAGGIAHDFNNILMTIIGHVDLALMDLPEDHAVRPDIETIGKASEKASRLTRQLLTFSRKEMVEMSAMDLNASIVEMSTMLKRVIRENIELELDLDPDCGNIKADAGKIEQILMNLVINARDAMPDGGRLVIGTRRETDPPPGGPSDVAGETRTGNRIVLSLSDTGTGIPPEIMDNIFDPFFSTKDSGKGTGLGLSTVYGLVKQHDATISVDSSPGLGTRFDIRFPEVTSGIDRAERETARPARGGRETILLVEDSRAIRKVLSTMLSKLGYNLMIAEDGIRALEMVSMSESRIDLALTDVIMPHMNGKVLIDRLKRIQPQIKVIYMSGYTDDLIGEQSVVEEGSTFIQKPISYSKLASTVRTVLDG